MAAPSLSTALPEPRNSDKPRDSQPVTPAKAGVHDEAGLDSGLRRNDEDTLNRRSLLTGAAACAVAGPSVAAAGARLPGGPDPALIAYARVKEVDSWFVGVLSDEDDPYYLALLAAYDRAEAAFADTRATTPAGVRAKLNHVAYLYAPDAEGQMCRSPLATSIVADFRHLLRPV